MGAEFTRNQDGSLHLTREGGHSERRIVHASDVTGREIERALLAAAAANPNITFFEHHLATDLLYDEVNGMRHCLGADVLDQQAQAMIRFVAPVTMLATGGAGQVGVASDASWRPCWSAAGMTKCSKVNGMRHCLRPDVLDQQVGL